MSQHQEPGCAVFSGWRHTFLLGSLGMNEYHSFTRFQSSVLPHIFMDFYILLHPNANSLSYPSKFIMRCFIASVVNTTVFLCPFAVEYCLCPQNAKSHRPSCWLIVISFHFIGNISKRYLSSKYIYFSINELLELNAQLHCPLSVPR